MPGQITVEQIAYDSEEFQQAASLRYELFFAEHNLPWSVVFDERQRNYCHGAIVLQNCVVAYGQLLPQSNGIYRICQMVVTPQYQRQNLGSKILLFLIELAKKQGAIGLVLDARLSAVGFYRKHGFQTCGEQFPSSTTGILHIVMNRELRIQQ